MLGHQRRSLRTLKGWEIVNPNEAWCQFFPSKKVRLTPFAGCEECVETVFTRWEARDHRGKVLECGSWLTVDHRLACRLRDRPTTNFGTRALSLRRVSASELATSSIFFRFSTSAALIQPPLSSHQSLILAVFCLPLELHVTE